MSSLRAPALRACALAAGLTFLGGASAQAAERVTAAKAVARSCHDRYLGATKSTDVSRTTAPSTGLVRARLAGPRRLGRRRLRREARVATSPARPRSARASSPRASSARGSGCVVQACRYRGGAAGAKLSVSYLGVEGGAKAAARQGPGGRRRARRPGGQEPPAGARPRPHRARRRRLRRGRAARRRRRARSCATPASRGTSGSPTSSRARRPTAPPTAASRRRRRRRALPSGRTGYRRLADYELEMKQLAARYPSLVKPVTLAETHAARAGRSTASRSRANADDIQDGKPMFLMMGVHHAREWPSSEHAMEFAYDLLTNYGKSAPHHAARRTRRARSSCRSSTRRVQPVARGAHDGPPAPGFAVQAQELPRHRRARTPRGRARAACRSTAARASTPTATTAACGAARARASTRTATPTAAPARSPSPRRATSRSSSRAARSTNLITNHTYGNLMLRPPGLVGAGPADRRAAATARSASG